MSHLARRWWVQVHLWLGLTLGALGVLIGLTGSVLVYDQQIDRWLNPQRYSSGEAPASLPLDAYLASASTALAGRARPASLRLPEAAGDPVVVIARGRDAASGPVRLYLDPPTARVLEVADSGGFLGWAHRFHENLSLREYKGREIVGLVGFAMLISALTGLYLWWPARGRLRKALGPRPGFTLSRNLHYLFGLYGAIVLAMLSFTGIWLAYVDAGRAVVSVFSPVGPRNMQLPDSAEGGTPIAPGAAVQIAQALYPGAPVTGLGLPNGARGVYRVSLHAGGSAAPVNAAAVFIDPRSGAVLRHSGPATRTGGEQFLVLQRLLHNGEALGALGRAAIFFVGLLPALLVATGATMWLRTRRRPPART